MPESYILAGDNVAALRTFPDNSIDSVVTDPPYGLSKEPDIAEVLTHWLAGDDYKHTGSGFMGKTWDSFVPGPGLWREVFRVLKPGGHVLSFAGTRTYDLMVIAMRLAGFQIRDQLAWMYGTGFPKSLNVSKAIDKALGVEHEKGDSFNVVGQTAASNGGSKFRSDHPDYVKPTALTPEARQWDGWGTALKPAQEPIVLARKPLAKGSTVAANVLAHGTGGINVDACRAGTPDVLSFGSREIGDGVKYGTMPKDRQTDGRQNTAGRWPANVILDEAAGAILDEQSGALKAGVAVRGNNTQGGATSIDKPHAPGTPDLGYGDTGGASRFFYCSKASKAEREAGLESFGAETVDDGRTTPNDTPRLRGKTKRKNIHPTVKPIALMRYLVRLVTPPGGIVLDPYAGSGTTGIASKLEGFDFVGLEISDEYCAIARARIAQT